MNRQGSATHRVQVRKIFAPTRETPSFSFAGEVIVEPRNMSSVDEFIKKDVLDNKMEDLLDQSGALNIHLKMSGMVKTFY